MSNISRKRISSTHIDALATDPVTKKTPGISIMHANLAAVVIAHPAREQLIREAAYHHAEARGFESGHELEDWLMAEVEVDTRLSGEGRAY